MAIQTADITEFQEGIEKTIEASAMGMILDTLQKFQYQYPVKSTIRELVSNAVDSTKERDIAKAILSGNAQEEDYFLKRDDEVFKDSNFNAAYYDPAWLGNESKVKVIYEEGQQMQKDKVRIIDQGVGLGGKRLEGSLRLGFSTKRNAKFALGRFGIGAKSALSTGVDYYTMISRYNGMEFHFNIYSHKVDSIVPHMSIVNGTMVPNQHYTFANGYKAYYLSTKEPNGVEIIIETKKHRKQEYLDAVKSQLMYFDNVELYVKNEYGTQLIPTKATVLYEDDYLIVSDNNQHSKPHLVINKVNYGFIDWNELELEQKFGPVGIKVEAEEVAVNPSRESVIWDETTKAIVQKRFRQAADAATKLVQERLKVTDFVEWLRTWSSIKSYRGQGSDALSKLSGIVDMQQLEPVYQPDPTLKAGHMALLFPGIQVQKILKQEIYKGGNRVQKLIRDDVTFVTDLGSDAPIYTTNSKPGTKVLRYLATANPYTGFYLIRYPSNLDVEGHADAEETDDWIKAFSLYPAFDKIKDGAKDTEITKAQTTVTALPILKERRKKVVRLLTSSMHTTFLSTVVVPDSFSWLDEEDVVDEKNLNTGNISTTYLTAEEKRKLEERVVAFTPRGFDWVPYKYTAPGTTQRLFEWQKVEPKLAKVQSLAGEEIYYGTNKDEVALHLVAAITQSNSESSSTGFYGTVYNYRDIDANFKDEWGLKNTYSGNSYFNNWGPKAKAIVLKVAQDQVKHYKAYKPVEKFFLQTDNNIITMSQLLIQWHTARIIKKSLNKLKFLHNFQAIDPQRALAYKKLTDYVNSHYVDVERLARGNKYFGIQADIYNEMIEHQEKVMQLQLFIRKNPDDKDAIAAMSKSLFDIEFEGAIGVDIEAYELLQELLEYSEPIRTLLNHIEELTEAFPGSQIDPALEAEIRFYLDAKGVS